MRGDVLRRNLCVVISLFFIFTGCYYKGTIPPTQNYSGNIPTPPESYRALSLEARSPILYNTFSTPGSKFIAIQTDGSAWMLGAQGKDSYWGSVYEGPFTTPVNIVEQVASVSVGTSNRFVILEDSTLWGWGQNHSGGLGDSTFEPRHELVKILENVLMVQAGSDNTAALLEDGSLYYWGNYIYGDIKDIFDSEGRLRHAVPYPVLALDKVKYFDLYADTLLALREDNSVWGWSLNDEGQLGLGHNRKVPTLAPVKLKENAQNMWVGWNNCYVLDNSSTLWGAGYNAYGAVGLASKDWEITQFSAILDNVVDFACGAYHATALTADGRMWIWGNNKQGQLGIGKETVGQVNYPVYVMDEVVKVYAYSECTAAIRDDGTLWVWGEIFSSDIMGQRFTEQNADLPTKIADNVHSVYPALSELFFLKHDGTLWGWGDNRNGQLGDGTFKSNGKPVMIMENVRLPY